MSGVDDSRASKFPKLEECAHFHYDFVELGHVQISLSDDNQENLFLRDSLSSSPPQPHFHIAVTSKDRTWLVRRSYENLRGFDRQLHRCIFDRKFSQLPELRRNELTEEGIPAMKKLLILYLNRLSAIAGNMINCGPILSWLEMDNRGNRLVASDDSAINTPAVGAAHVTKRYIRQAADELSLEVGDMLSIIDMPPGDESVWWRGKKGFEVGFFPAECVEMIGEKLPQSVASKLPESRPKPVLRRRGKLISLLRNFFTSRPARTQLKRTGIVKERVFGCDLGEHLLNSERHIPLVLECCTQTIETHGIVDGIYRLSGVASNIQRLRNEFDEEKQPTLTDECYLQDIHSISSLLKAYFRDLPNPLFTFQLYDKFIAAIQDEENKLTKIHDVIQQLPPPHYRTAKYLMEHLSRVAEHGAETGMHCKNLAIVWAPNLLRSKDLELACSTAALQGVGIQAIVTEYLIAHAEIIFSDQLQNVAASGSGQDGSLRRGRPKSLALSTPTKLLSLEDARAIINPSTSPKQKYIEVGGGPASLPEKYHTVIDLPGKKKSRKDRKSPVPMTGWRAIFSKKSVAGSGKERSERLGSVESTTSVTEGFGGEYEHESEELKHSRLRMARSADSLLGDVPVRTVGHMNRYSDTTSDGSTYVNPYTDEHHNVRPHTITSLDRSHSNNKKIKATKRSISADNSYSEGEMDGGSPEKVCMAAPEPVSPRTGLLSELENRLRGRSVSTTPPHDASPVDGLGSLPILSHPTAPASGAQLSRPRSQLLCLADQQQQPKRSKSTALDEVMTDHSMSLCDLPPVPPRQKSDTAQFTKGKVMSPGKRKKAKAPLPPVIPPRKQAAEDSEEVTKGRDSSMEDLVTIELTESPGARRKLLYSAPSDLGTTVTGELDNSANSALEPEAPCELDNQGTEGAPGEMAAEMTLTDDEAFNTQNLSLTTTDSENDVNERREGMSNMDGVQDSLSQEEGAQDVAGMINCEEEEEEEGGREGLVHCEAEDQEDGDDVEESLMEEENKTLEGGQEEMVSVGTTEADQIGLVQSQLVYSTKEDYSATYDHHISASDFDLYRSAGARDKIYCQTSGESSGMDDSGLLSKSLSSVLTGAAGGTTYYSSDDISNRGGAGCLSFADSNSDSHFSGATMSTNFTSSSELPCVSTSDESDFTSAADYADQLRTGSEHVLRKSLVAYSTTSDSDLSCSGALSTPRVDAEFTFSPSDTDTEIAKTPVNFQDSDRQTPHIDLSDAEVTFVDPVDPEDTVPRPSASEADQSLGSPPQSHETTAEVIGLPRLPEDLAASESQTSSILPAPAETDLDNDILYREETSIKTLQLPVEECSAPTDQASAPRLGDGYLADRSSSASPTFCEANSNAKKITCREETEEYMASMPLPTELGVIPESASSSSLVKASSEAHSICETLAGRTHENSVKKSVESLLFDLEDVNSCLGTDSAQGSESKLNFTSENDDVFYRPQSVDDLRSETNMSVSPDNYLEDRCHEKESKGFERDSSESMDSLTQNRPPTLGTEYHIRSATSLEKKKKEVTRKKSVRELMSKFESSSTPSGESSDDAVSSKMSASVDSITETTADYSLRTASLPRKPSARITSRIRSLQQSPSVSSSDDGLTENVTCSEMRPTPSPAVTIPTAQPIVTFSSSVPVQSSSDFTAMSSSTSLAIASPSITPQTATSTAASSISQNLVSSLSSSSSVSAATNATETLTTGLHPDSTDSADDLSTSPRITDLKRRFEDQRKKSSDTEGDSPGKGRLSLSERLQSLSDRFKNYEEVGEDSPPPRIQSSKAGQFVTRAASHTESSTSRGGSDGEKVAKLRDRRQKFESYGPGDGKTSEEDKQSGRLTVEGKTNQKRTDSDDQHHISVSQEKSSEGQHVSIISQKGSDSTKPHRTESRSVMAHNQLSTTSDAAKPSEEPGDTSMSPRQLRRAERRRRRGAEDEKVISVRDLSRQFERQLSDKPDKSTSTRWSCAHDVANGNNIIPTATCEQGDIVGNRSVTAQQTFQTTL